MPDNERLCALAQAGDTAARELLVVTTSASYAGWHLRCMAKPVKAALPWTTLVQEGCIGLLSAVDKFDAGERRELPNLRRTGDAQRHDRLRPCGALAV